MSDRIETVQAWVQQAGYRAEISETGDTIYSAAGGLKFALTLVGRDTAQLYLSMSLEGDPEFSNDDCNRFNQKFRFGKIYIDEDRDLMMEDDFILPSADEGGKQVLERQLELWEGVIGILRNYMREMRDSRASAPRA